MPDPSSPLAVLNPGGRDREQIFPRGADSPDPELHPPVNFHAYAFCAGGSFYRDAERVPPEVARVLILLRADFGRAEKALELLKSRGKECFLAFKESGADQVAKALAKPGQWSALREMFRVADGAISPTPDLLAVYRAAGARKAVFLPTPYPTDIPAWNFARPAGARAGIFLGTRQFDVASRRHLPAVHIACEIASERKLPVTLIDDGSCPSRLRKNLRKLHPLLRWTPGPLAYPDYLGLLAGHAVVFQLDSGRVPGQVAGDCVLARLLCVGGEGAIERLVFPETCGYGRSWDELGGLLEKSLDESGWREARESEAGRRASDLLSFRAGARRLEEFFSMDSGGGSSCGGEHPGACSVP